MGNGIRREVGQSLLLGRVGLVFAPVASSTRFVYFRAVSRL